MDDVPKIIEKLGPRIAAAVRRTKECLDWKICYRDPIHSWISKSHKVALFGDSCHPRLSTSAEGGSQAMESGAVLALCLKLARKANVPLATRVYEKLRFDRFRKCQMNGEDLRDRWHSALKTLEAGEKLDPEQAMHSWLYPYDAEAESPQRWNETSTTVEKELKESKITPLFNLTPIKLPT